MAKPQTQDPDPLERLRELARKHGGRLILPDLDSPHGPEIAIDIPGLEGLWVSKGIIVSTCDFNSVRADLYIPRDSNKAMLFRMLFRIAAEKYGLEYDDLGGEAILYASVESFDRLVGALREFGQAWKALKEMWL
jgi:hypothetical protein